MISHHITSYHTIPYHIISYHMVMHNFRTRTTFCFTDYRSPSLPVLEMSLLDIETMLNRPRTSEFHPSTATSTSTSTSTSTASRNSVVSANMAPAVPSGSGIGGEVSYTTFSTATQRRAAVMSDIVRVAQQPGQRELAGNTIYLVEYTVNDVLLMRLPFD